MESGQYSQVLIDKAALERIRMRLASGVKPEMLERASRALSRPVSATTAVVPATKNADMRASVLMEQFLAAKASHWKPDRQERMRKMCGRFVELMEDPLLTDINRQFVQAYRKQLLLLPSDVKAARKKHSTSSLKALIKLADDHGEERLAETTALDYVDKLSEMLGWAAIEEYMQRNPAKGISGAASPRARVREQDQRQQFSSDELNKIFSAEWFVEGAGKANSAGRFREYQPHYFWLPLLGLYTGGRVNELAHLYLADIKQDVAGTLYIDFNLEGAGKVDDDQGVETSTAGDKSLKTINSVRQVPMHGKLIELGLPLYASALKAAGHDRLFPDLSHHHVEGYGKSAGAWFNERYLGNKLQIARDGKKTFHSLRHTLTTALYVADVPPPKVAQVLGHERGESISETRYNKDKIPSELQAYVDMVDFKLPHVSPFNVKIGICAVADALDRKKRLAKNILKADTEKWMPFLSKPP
jgi:integrase